MAFPTSPIDGQLYTNALGTVYQYVLADTAWKIVGSGATGFIYGSGTATYIPIWTDGTTLGDSIMTSTGGIVQISGSTVLNGAGTNGYLAKYNDAANGVMNNSCVQQVSNGISVNTAPGGDTYVSLGNGYEKVWLTRKGDTDSFAIGLSEYGSDALILDQTTGNTHLPAKLGVGPTLKTNAKINTYQTAGTDKAIDLYRSGLAHGCTDLSPTDVYGQLKCFNEGAGYGGLTIQGLNSDATGNGGSGGLMLHGLSTCLGTGTDAVEIRGSLISGTAPISVDPTWGVLNVTNNGDMMMRIIGNGDTTTAGSIQTGNDYNSRDGYAGVTNSVGTGEEDAVLGVFDSGRQYIDIPYTSGFETDYWRIQIKNGLITYAALTLG